MYLLHNYIMINAKHSHVWYTWWLCFCQGLPVGTETGRAVNESTVLLQPLCDLLLPLKSSYWCRIKSRQQSQIWVEVVYLTKMFHNLDKLDNIAFPILGFVLLQNPWPCPKYVRQETLSHTNTPLTCIYVLYCWHEHSSRKQGTATCSDHPNLYVRSSCYVINFNIILPANCHKSVDSDLHWH